MYPLYTKKQLIVLYFLTLAWFIIFAIFWFWWFQRDHIITPIRFFFNSILLFWTIGLPGYFFYFALRAKRPKDLKSLPKWRVAMVVTKAPSEPWEMVQETLEAMLTQRFPLKYDVWLADEDPSLLAYEWCENNNVQISTRKDNIKYHNSNFPGRTKTKEGNLRYFYDMYGYEKYDFICQLDADHVPESDYLLHMISPFIDDKIGYVAAPSICDKNYDESWTVRARLFVEATMHGPLQAGYNDGWSPNPIGSHYAVRTKAVKSLVHRRGDQVIYGGLGPELAEDHSTGLAMNSAGWRGAFAINAIAHGDGAVGIGDSIKQEFQWSRSLVMLLLRWTPGYLKTLPFKLKFQYLFAQLWYPLFGLFMLCSILLPIFALFGHTPWVNVNYILFLGFMFPLTFISIIIVYYLADLKVLRPHNAKIISWETVLFQFVRWPWVLYACVIAFIDWARNKEFVFRITPKGETASKRLSSTVLMPYYAIIIVSLSACFLVTDPGAAVGYFYFCLLNALIYTVVVVSILLLHIKENYKRDHFKIVFFKDLLPNFIVSSVLLGTFVFAFMAKYTAILFMLSLSNS
jgi:cellulose synthase (UDP-forming)